MMASEGDIINDSLSTPTTPKHGLPFVKGFRVRQGAAGSTGAQVTLDPQLYR